MSRTSSHPRSRVAEALGAIALLLLLGATSSAAAKPPRLKKAAAGHADAARSERSRSKRTRSATVAAPAPSPAAEPAKAERPDSRADAQRRAAQDAALGADAQVVREGDTQVKVMNFEGIDIEGRLKSPQLLYFVGRVHAEFDRPTLPHRSFMPELESSTHTAPVQ